MSSTEAMETPGAKRSLSSRLRAHGRKAAIPALLLSITVGGLAGTAHAADSPQCPPNNGAGTCPAGPDKGKAPVSGDADHPGRLTPGKTQDRALKLWQALHFPSWRDVGDRDDQFEVNSWTDQFGVHHEEWLETGGRYWDNGGSLRDFMNGGGAGPSSRNYAGTFQEYVAHSFDHRPGWGERTGSDRFVRAISSGDTWVTYDHYKSFIYLGKYWW